MYTSVNILIDLPDELLLELFHFCINNKGYVKFVRSINLIQLICKRFYDLLRSKRSDKFWIDVYYRQTGHKYKIIDPISYCNPSHYFHLKEVNFDAGYAYHWKDRLITIDYIKGKYENVAILPNYIEIFIEVSPQHYYKSDYYSMVDDDNVIRIYDNVDSPCIYKGKKHDATWDINKNRYGPVIINSNIRPFRLPDKKITIWVDFQDQEIEIYGYNDFETMDGYIILYNKKKQNICDLSVYDLNTRQITLITCVNELSEVIFGYDNIIVGLIGEKIVVFSIKDVILWTQRYETKELYVKHMGYGLIYIDASDNTYDQTVVDIYTGLILYQFTQKEAEYIMYGKVAFYNNEQPGICICWTDGMYWD